jgi:hypothetical protein
MVRVDGGDAADALEGLLERAREVLAQVRQVGGGLGARDQARDLVGVGAVGDGAEARPVGVDQTQEVVARVPRELDVVADELGGRVDLVGDAGGQASDGLELLGLPQLELHLAAGRQRGDQAAVGAAELAVRLGERVALAVAADQHRPDHPGPIVGHPAAVHRDDGEGRRQGPDHAVEQGGDVVDHAEGDERGDRGPPTVVVEGERDVGQPEPHRQWPPGEVRDGHQPDHVAGHPHQLGARRRHQGAQAERRPYVEGDEDQLADRDDQDRVPVTPGRDHGQRGDQRPARRVHGEQLAPALRGGVGGVGGGRGALGGAAQHGPRRCDRRARGGSAQRRDITRPWRAMPAEPARPGPPGAVLALRAAPRRRMAGIRTDIQARDSIGYR